MKVKLVEVRDRGTCVPAIAIKTTNPENEAEQWLWHRSGYHGAWDRGEEIILARIDGSADRQLIYDIYDWHGSITMQAAHEWLIDHFDEIENGAVVDAEFIRGESVAPRQSDRFASSFG